MDELRAKLDALARKTARTAVAADISLQGHLLSAAELYDDARRLLEPRRDGEAGDRHAELCRQRAVLLRHLAIELGSPGAVLEKAYGDESGVAALKTQQPPGRWPGATPPRGGGARAGGQAMAGNRTLGGQARQGHWDSKEALAIPKFQCRLEDLPPDEASPQRQQSRSASPTRRQPEPCSSSPPRRAPSGASLRPSSTELARCSLPNESHFVHSATAQLMQESHVPAVPSRGASLEARPAPHFRDNLSASTGAWVREVTGGMDAKALASNGALVPVTLRLDLDQGMLHVAVPGDARDLRLKDIDEVLLGEEAHRVLEGRIPSRPSGDVCALQLHDGNCLALQLPPHVAQAFAQHLLRVCQAERRSARGPPAGGGAEALPPRPSPPQAVPAPPQAVASTFAPSFVSMPSFTPPSVGSSVALASGAPAPGTATPPGQGGLGSARGPAPAELVVRRCGTSPVMVPLAAAVPSNCWSSGEAIWSH